MGMEQAREDFLEHSRVERETLMRFEGALSERVTAVTHRMESETYVGDDFAEFMTELSILGSITNYFRQYVHDMGGAMVEAVANAKIVTARAMAEESGETFSRQDAEAIVSELSAELAAATNEGTRRIAPIQERVMGPRKRFLMELAAKLSGINNQKDNDA